MRENAGDTAVSRLRDALRSPVLKKRFVDKLREREPRWRGWTLKQAFARVDLQQTAANAKRPFRHVVEVLPAQGVRALKQFDLCLHEHDIGLNAAGDRRFTRTGKPDQKS